MREHARAAGPGPAAEEIDAAEQAWAQLSVNERDRWPAGRCEFVAAQLTARPAVPAEPGYRRTAAALEVEPAPTSSCAGWRCC